MPFLHTDFRSSGDVSFSQPQESRLVAAEILARLMNIGGVTQSDDFPNPEVMDRMAAHLRERFYQAITAEKRPARIELEHGDAEADFGISMSGIRWRMIGRSNIPIAFEDESNDPLFVFRADLRSYSPARVYSASYQLAMRGATHIMPVTDHLALSSPEGESLRPLLWTREQGALAISGGSPIQFIVGVTDITKICETLAVQIHTMHGLLSRDSRLEPELAFVRCLKSHLSRSPERR